MDRPGVPPSNGEILDDYLRWHDLQVSTGDIDPVYPVYRSIIESERLDLDSAAWLVICHVTYYHVASALKAFRLTGGNMANLDSRIDDLAAITLTGTERRAHRSPAALRRHLDALARDLEGQPYAWLSQNWTWAALNNRIASIHGNGRWAAYKQAEMLQKVIGAPTAATDAGHAHSSGPRRGIELLFDDMPQGNTPSEIAYLDALTLHLARKARESDVAQIETSLCDFHSLVKGRYYLGADIDQLLEQSYRADPVDRDLILKARLNVFDHRYLGEIGGWTGIDKDRKKIYAKTRVIVER